MPFYNTNNSPDKAERDEKAQTQQDRILCFFKKHKDGKFTPLEVYRLAGLTCPITSVRRAITDLTKENLLIKTNETVTESYGSYNFKWKLNKNVGQTEIDFPTSN
jgi:predicted transcriptional regulator